MIRIPRKLRPGWGAFVPDDVDRDSHALRTRLGPEDWMVEELTEGQAADLIQRQRRQIANLKERVGIAEMGFDAMRLRFERETKAYVAELESLRKRLKAEERLERAKAHRLVPIRHRRHIES